jgi:hypothetical protein
MIRIGKTFVNLDRVTHVLTSDATVSVYFSADDDWISFRGLEADALFGYLNGASADVLSLQLAIESDERRWDGLVAAELAHGDEAMEAAIEGHWADREAREMSPC